MSSPPKEHPKGVAINIPRKKSNLFQNYKDVKILAVDDVLVRQVKYLKTTIELEVGFISRVVDDIDCLNIFYKPVLHMYSLMRCNNTRNKSNVWLGN